MLLRLATVALCLSALSSGLPAGIKVGTLLRSSTKPLLTGLQAA